MRRAGSDFAVSPKVFANAVTALTDEGCDPCADLRPARVRCFPASAEAGMGLIGGTTTGTVICLRGLAGFFGAVVATAVLELPGRAMRASLLKSGVAARAAFAMGRLL